MFPCQLRCLAQAEGIGHIVAALLTLLQQAGPIREITIQPQNIDHMIADMYREMAL